MRITRRGLFGWLAAAAARGASGEASPVVRRYRVDATILLFSFPVFTHSGVGSGYSRHSLSPEPDRTTHHLEFAAGSLPEQAHGLNRLGMLRETVAENAQGILDARYFGFMTASREENFDEAKKALEDASQASLFVAIEGESHPGQVRSRRARFSSGVRAGWADWQKLLPQAETACRNAAPGDETVEPAAGASASPTFLYSLFRAIRSREGKLRQICVYSRDRFELVTEKKTDPRTRQRLAAKGIVANGASVLRINGTIRNLRTGGKTPFSIWVEEGGPPTPLRIEYQPRGFLRLALEAERS